MEKITIKIENKDFTIKQSFRALMLFEEMTDKTINEMNESVADILKLFYCILKANNVDTFNWSFEQFLDIVDEQPEVFTHFTDYLQEQVKGEKPVAQKKIVSKKK
jgi:hypothetical protein